MDEEKKREWDVRLAIIAPLLTVLTIGIGVWQFNSGEDNRKDEQISAEERRGRDDFQRQLWLQKSDAYRKIADLAGEVIAVQDGTKAERDNAFHKFMTAYWGTMILVEDDRVETAMKGFYLALRDVRSGWSKDTGRLKDKADDLVLACRTDMEASPALHTRTTLRHPNHWWDETLRSRRSDG